LEIRNMFRKCLAFTLSTALLVSLAGVGLSFAQDEGGSELEKIMEQVQKHNIVITKGTRNEVYFKKSKKDVEKSAKELVKLAKKAKPIKEALSKAKDEKDPSKKWDELLDSLVKNSEKLGDVVAQPDATLKASKAAFKAVTKNCSDCHLIFRVDDTN
jgi:cytochrome c556